MLEERLRTAGFLHHTREGAPICRWIVEEDVTADIMPTEAGVLGLESKWFREALQNASERDLGGGITAPVITPPYFLATKLAAYRDRGAADPWTRKDLEDIVTLLDGCEQIVSLVANCDDALRTFIWQDLKADLENADFADAWPCYFRSDQILATKSESRSRAVRAIGRYISPTCLFTLPRDETTRKIQKKSVNHDWTPFPVVSYRSQRRREDHRTYWIRSGVWRALT